MATAMARGWAAGEGGPATMLFSDLDRGRAAAIAEEVGGQTRVGLGDLARDCDLLLLAVKPDALDDVAAELDGRAPALISVIAATRVARIREAFPGVPLIRVMPNQPAQVRSGLLCYVSPEGMSGELESEVKSLLGALGALVQIEEELMDAAMAVMSCTPAYFALIAGTLGRAGEREGLEPELAGDLVARTMLGTGELLLTRTPDEIQRAVAPPGGATEAGLRALERGGLEPALDDAVRASLERFR